jgi:hypothetical protein
MSQAVKSGMLFSDASRARAAASRATAKNTTELIKQGGLDLDKGSEASVLRRLEDMPPGMRSAYVLALRGRSIRSAVTAFCRECVGWEREEVRRCTSHACPLYPYRPYK